MRINPYDCDNNTIYLSPGKKKVNKWIDGVYLELELAFDFQNLDHLKINRVSAYEQAHLQFYVDCEAFNNTGETVFEDRDRTIFFSSEPDPVRYSLAGHYCRISLPPIESHLAVKITNIIVDGKSRNFEKQKRELCNSKKKRGHFRDAICRFGDVVRVNTKILSDNCQYFKQLFDEIGDQKSFKIDCNWEDLLQYIYCLPPFNLRVSSGPTYGALFRLSELFKCYKIGDLAINYMDQLKKYTPLSASYIAMEGKVPCESKLYWDTLCYGHDNLRELLENEREKRAEWYKHWHLNENDTPYLYIELPLEKRL